MLTWHTVLHITLPEVTKAALTFSAMLIFFDWMRAAQ